jgi:hypothetical protein
MYGDKQVFSGRIIGFTIETGSTLALLPPQNATKRCTFSHAAVRFKRDHLSINSFVFSGRAHVGQCRAPLPSPKRARGLAFSLPASLAVFRPISKAVINARSI